MVSEHGDAEQVDTGKIVWDDPGPGPLVRLRVSSRLVASGKVRRQDAEAAGAQLAGAAAVAVLATVPVLVLPGSDELDVVRLVLAALIALVGYAVARGSGATRARSDLYAASILLVATVVALVKNVLAGH